MLIVAGDQIEAVFKEQPLKKPPESFPRPGEADGLCPDTGKEAKDAD